MCVIGCDHNNVVRRKRCTFRRHGVECAPCSIGAFKPLTTCIVLKIIIVVSRVRAIAAAELSSSAAAPIVIIIIIWPGKRCAKKISRAHALTHTHYIHVIRTHTLDSTHMSHAIQTQPVFNKCVYFALRARRRRYSTLLVRTHTYTGCCPRRGFTNGIRRGRHVCSTASLLPAYSEKPKTLILGRRRSAQCCCIQGNKHRKTHHNHYGWVILQFRITHASSRYTLYMRVCAWRWPEKLSPPQECARHMAASAQPIEKK